MKKKKHIYHKHMVSHPSGQFSTSANFVSPFRVFESLKELNINSAKL